MPQMRADRLITAVLAEDRLPALQKKWGDKLSTNHDVRMDVLSNRSQLAFHQVVDMDPTPNKQYADRLLHWYHHGQFRVEDAHRVRGAVEKFHQLKTKIKPEHVNPGINPKDINTYPHLHNLEASVDNVAGEQTKSMTKATDRAVVDKGSTLLHKDDGIEVRKVNDVHAMKVLGRGTKWCTAADHDNMFSEYHKEGPLYFIHDKKNNEKYLHHAESNQFMDERDAPAEHKAEELGQKHPILHKLLHHPQHGPFFDNAKAKADVERHLSGVGRGLNHDTLSGYGERSSDPGVLDDLSHMVGIKIHIAQNKHTAPHTLRRLAHEEPYAVIRNPSADSEALHTAVGHVFGMKTGYDPARMNTSATRLAGATTAAQHKNAVPDTLRLIMQHEPNAAKAVAHSPVAPADVLHKIAVDGPYRSPVSDFLPTDIHAVAKHPNTQANTLELLHQKYGGKMHDYLASHPNTPSHVLHAVAKEEYKNNSINNRISRHPNVTAETQHGLDTHFGALTQNRYDQNPNYQGPQSAEVKARAAGMAPR